MALERRVYKCELCGNIVEVLFQGEGAIVCCGKDMTLLDEKSADSATEKHVPIIEKIEGGYRVTVGSTLHPMTEEHFIQWIELNTDTISYKNYLKAGDKPIAEFLTDAVNVGAREYCNIHGLWKDK